MKNQDSIINVEPKIRSKGFKNENFYSNLDKNNANINLFKKINNAVDNIENSNLSHKNKQILVKIQNSYIKYFEEKS